MESIRVEGISKRYRSGKTDLWSELTGWGGGAKKTSRSEIWALKDLSFTVDRGEAVGVIGANGAGKTTLLRVLARVTTPTAGRALIDDRVFSLLSLGSGLQPDETGRENIRVHGAFYGLSAGDTEKLVEEVLVFAELEKFSDVLVRHYSSGMYLRLAFSIAVCLRPQVLLADEVLAVGDIGFQKKCLEKLRQISRSGVTVLLVSHDMALIRDLCGKCLWIDHGQKMAFGPSREVTTAFEDFLLGDKEKRTSRSAGTTGKAAEKPSNEAMGMISAGIVSKTLEPIGMARTSEDFYIRIRFETYKDKLSLGCVMDLYCDHTLVFRSGMSGTADIAEKGVHDVLIRIPAQLLADREYEVRLHCRADDPTGQYPLVWQPALLFQMHEDGSARFSETFVKYNRHVIIAPKLEWTLGKNR